jgi:hypothetical protein
MLDSGGEEHRNQKPHPVSPKGGETGWGNLVGRESRQTVVTLKMTTGHGPISLVGRGAVPASGHKPRP